MTQWTANDIPDLQGRVALVTGANSGLGLATTQALAAKGARVIMAVRNPSKGQAALAQITAQVPGAALELMPLDLASFASVQAFAAQVRAQYTRLDFLFNNAGVMAIPRQLTSDGFESQYETNFLSHFALTGLVLPLLLATPQSRVVTTTSIARMIARGRINFADRNGEQSYNRWMAYGQSKLEDLLFAGELQRRLSQAGATTISVAAHPGYARTGLQSTSTQASGSLVERIGNAAMTPLTQTAQMGAWPQLFAAISPTIHGGELVGPGGFMHLRGHPQVEPNHEGKLPTAQARRLWDLAVDITGVDFSALATKTLPQL
jgi:NAD(P)-dependent dehydrogenase (short-subunit alcohol dehydrogenase family)